MATKLAASQRYVFVSTAIAGTETDRRICYIPGSNNTSATTRVVDKAVRTTRVCPLLLLFLTTTATRPLPSPPPLFHATNACKTCILLWSTANKSPAGRTPKTSKSSTTGKSTTRAAKHEQEVATLTLHEKTPQLTLGRRSKGCLNDNQRGFKNQRQEIRRAEWGRWGGAGGGKRSCGRVTYDVRKGSPAWSQRGRWRRGTRSGAR